MNAPPGITQHVAGRIARLPLADVPQPALAAARRLMLDTLAVAHAGAASPDVRAVMAMAAEQGGRPDSLPWGMGTRLPAPEAALVNAMAASALDFDSLHEKVHPDAIALAASWSVAQRMHASGAAMLAAFIASSELICRLSRACRGPQKGWTIGAVLGTFGAAASAARLLGLDEQGIGNALGLALSMAGGSQQSNVEQVLSKRLQPGLAARAGVQAALLARAGITAPRQALEGRFGLWSLYFPGDEAELRDIFDPHGRYALEDTGLKLHPVCACSHAAMEALAQMQAEGGFEAAQIAHVEALISPFMDRLVGGAFKPEANPQVTAQFCLRYQLAVIMARGRFTLEDLEDRLVLDPSIAPWAARVALTIDPAREGELVPATVRLTLHDGRILERTVSLMPGSTASPLTSEQLDAKHLACLGLADPSPAQALQELRALTDNIERVPDMAGTGESPRGV